MVNIGPGYTKGLSASGQVVGESRNHAFAWSARQGMIPLGTLGGTSSSAVGVNASGQVVGYSYTSDGQCHATLWQIEPAPLPPVADTYVRSGAWAAVNFSTSSTLLAKLGLTPDYTRRGYAKFDIGNNDTISTATLRLRAQVSGGSTERVRVGIFAVSSPSWEEQTLTWNTKPSYGRMLGIANGRGATPDWVETDLTEFVRTEQAAGRHVISVALRALEHTTAFAIIDSREAGLLGPQLVITSR